MLALGGGILSFMFGNWTTLLGVLVAFVILDYITGLIAAYLNGDLNSEHGLKGIAKKVFIFAMVSVGNFVDIALGSEPFIREVVIIFYISNEVISILENAGKAGIPVPQKLKKAIKILQEKGRN
ncbi:phage holin family protein [Bacillus tamaricis]|uniref:Phage holin family protein n=2 Tax=Evansella tamaricis TaxID=2069301 RepID=A0ABS6JLJ2_9BACI|nr:phage holin family protein [Evansella tamaricis]